MENLINSFANKGLQGLVQLAGGHITASVKAAADKTGVDFAYLLQQAKAESSFKADAQAKTSSATGLFQFIESTWLDMVDRHGDKHGINTAASKDELLELRNDPAIASTMAAELANDNKRVLDRNWGGESGATELYFAHFLGAGSAAAFLKARDANGSDPAAILFPKAAKANENVFYDRKTGHARSLDEVYAYFDTKFTLEGDDNSFEAPIQLAEDTPARTAPKAPIYAPLYGDLATPAMYSFDALSKVSESTSHLASYQSLIMNQMDLILLTQQLDLPLLGKDSTNKLL